MAWIPDGSPAIGYLPTARTRPVDLSKFRGPVAVHWFDPIGGRYQEGSGVPFRNDALQQLTPPAKNREGDTDWVLVLRTAK